MKDYFLLDKLKRSIHFLQLSMKGRADLTQEVIPGMVQIKMMTHLCLVFCRILKLSIMPMHFYKRENITSNHAHRKW